MESCSSSNYIMFMFPILLFRVAAMSNEAKLLMEHNPRLFGHVSIVSFKFKFS